MNTSQMYLNKFSTGTILALLAMSGMLVLVPIAAPAHATNGSPLIITNGGVFGLNPIEAGCCSDIELTITNPATNQYAVTAITVTVPNGNWYIGDCYTGYSEHFNSCTNSEASNSVEFSVTGSGTPLAPGLSDVIWFEVEAPSPSASLVYPYTGTFTTTVQDQSSAAFYQGPNFSMQVIADSSTLGDYVNVSPGGSNTASTYTAGTAPYTLSVQLTCSTSEPGCTTGYENGVNIEFGESNYGSDAIYSFSATEVKTSGSGSSGGTASTTFQPSNIASTTDGIGTADPWAAVTNCGLTYTCFTVGPVYAEDDIATVPATPSSVGFTIGDEGATFPSTAYLTTQATTVSTTAGYPDGYTGAQLCNNDTAPAETACTGAEVDAQEVGVAVTDKFGNAIAFGEGGVTFTGSQDISLQTASGAVFDAAGLPSVVTATPTASPFIVPDNYYQSSTWGTGGVISATIVGTYNGNPFSVSGSTGTIETGTFAGSVSFETTHHVDPFPATTVQAGKSYTFEVALNIPQTNVPISVAVCGYVTCPSTTKGYSGTITTVSGVSNSSGIFSTSLTVDTTAGSVAIVNATVAAPVTGDSGAKWTDAATNTITTIAGPAAKFSVIVGIGSDLDPSPITSSFPGQTVYVNVVASDAYGNPVSTASSEEVGISLSANPATLSDSNPAIPTGCASTNATAFNSTGKYTCADGDGSSFGPISWTLPSTVGSTATISATGVLNGVSVTSPTVSIAIVSKTPSVSVTSPAPVSGVIYSDSQNIQFRGWANASAGYNGQVTMVTLGWKIGSSAWSSTSLPAAATDQWSVVATLPTGLSTIQFNATDSKGNVGVTTTYQVLVDSAGATVTNVTPSGATLNPGQLFQATIVAPEGDLGNSTGAATPASGVTVWVNGTALSASDVTVTGSNDLGSSVTYTVTAVLPTGYDSVEVTALTLTGVSNSGAVEPVTVTVAFADSITFNIPSTTYGQVGAYVGFNIPVTNLWSASQTVVVFATLKSGSSIYVAQGTVTLAPGQTATVFAVDLSTVPAGTYTVTFSAVTTSNQAVSAPTAPATLVIP